VLGTDDLIEYLRKYNLSLSPFFQQNLGRHPSKALSSFINSDNKDLVSEEALDLLDQLFRYDKNQRLTAEEAMRHHYFDPVRLSS